MKIFNRKILVIIYVLCIFFICKTSESQVVNNVSDTILKNEKHSNYGPQVNIKKMYDCIKTTHLEIYDDSLDQKVQDIYFKIKDSLFIFKEGDSICVDSGTSKNALIYFYINNRLLSCPIKIEYGNLQLHISYYSTDRIRNITKKEAKKEYIGRKYLKYFYCIDDNPGHLISLPYLIKFGKKFKLEKMIYGLVEIWVGRNRYYIYDWRTIGGCVMMYYQ